MRDSKDFTKDKIELNGIVYNKITDGVFEPEMESIVNIHDFDKSIEDKYEGIDVIGEYCDDSSFIKLLCICVSTVGIGAWFRFIEERNDKSCLFIHTDCYHRGDGYYYHIPIC